MKVITQNQIRMKFFIFKKPFFGVGLLLVLLLFVLATVHFVVPFVREYRSDKARQENQRKILDGISTGPINVKVDFASQIAIGSPLIFGGVHSPNLDQQDAWDKLEEVGVTVIRRGIFIENEMPGNITLEDYKNNVNDIQNPQKWNLKKINITNENYQNAQKKGMKVMAIFAYAPAWLTYSGTTHGVPKDWDVYEDIIKKIYKLHKDNIDYIEVWNEPTLKTFLDLTNSQISREEAYKQIYYHAYHAIREAQQELNENKNIPIGGSVGHDPNDTSILEALLKDPQTKDLLDFVSYHNYEHLPEPSWLHYQKILSKYKKEQTPIFLTEWNYRGDEESNQDFRSGNRALTYTADKFVEFLKMGLKMANYYVMLDGNRPKIINDDPSFAFYKWANGKAELLPQAKTWRLLSNTLGLGKGESKVVEATFGRNTSLSAIGFVNSRNEEGFIFVNKEDSINSVNIEIQNIAQRFPYLGKIPLYVYYASPENNGSQIVERIYLSKGDQPTLLLPAQSVAGALIPQNPDLKDIIRSHLP